MDVGAGCGILVNGRNAEAGTVLANAWLFAARHLCERSLMIAEGLVGGDDHGLIGAPDTLRARTECAAIGLVVGGDEVVHAVDLIHVMSLANSVAFRNDDTRRFFFRSAHVGL